ncbi:MAG: FecR domain-containing protein [Burkholderiales bacterium]|nr:FecR domain-containing protein [Burkholderiales bacterium]
MAHDRQRFRLSRQGLMLALISAAFAGDDALAQTAARVDFAVGSVTAVGQDGRLRALGKGAEVMTGDRVETAAAGRAQLRFTDGAYVSLQPNTTFEVRDYHFTGRTDGSERGVFGLLRGAFRTVTGLIGRVNRGAYQIQTPTATVGIRGTGGVIALLDDGTLRVTGTSGTWFINKPNQKQLDVPAGKVGEASPAPGEDPVETTEEPILAPPQPGERQIAGVEKFPLPSGPAVLVAGNDVNAQGEYTAIVGTTSSTAPSPVTPPLSLDGFFDAVVFSKQVSDTFVDGPYLVAGEGKFDPPVGLTPSQGKLQDAASPNFASPTERFTLQAGGAHAEHGVAFEPSTQDVLVMAWGRWIGPVDGIASASPFSVTYAPEQGLHYIIGLPTLPIQIPTAGTFTYNLVGATAPTDGLSPPGSFTGTLVGNFISASPTVDVQGSAAVGGQVYTFQGSGITVNVTATSNNFSAAGLGPIAASPGSGCSSGCTTDLKGAFYGTGASHAGFVYKISATGAAEVTGAAAFAK